MRYVALLYSIVLAGGKRLSMAPLREMFSELGYREPETLLSTGNVIFKARKTDARTLEARLEAAFAKRFGKHIDFLVRTEADWCQLAAGNPLPKASAESPALVAVRVMRDPVDAQAMATLEARVRPGERLAFVGGDIWIYVPDGISASPLATAVSNTRIGIGTSRNWSTVAKIAARLT